MKLPPGFHWIEGSFLLDYLPDLRDQLTAARQCTTPDFRRIALLEEALRNAEIAVKYNTRGVLLKVHRPS